MKTQNKSFHKWKKRIITNSFAQNIIGIQHGSLTICVIQWTFSTMGHIEANFITLKVQIFKKVSLHFIEGYKLSTNVFFWDPPSNMIFIFTNIEIWHLNSLSPCKIQLLFLPKQKPNICCLMYERNPHAYGKFHFKVKIVDDILNAYYVLVDIIVDTCAFIRRCYSFDTHAILVKCICK